MLNFLKRFLWPSRISQESIGAMLSEQREEIVRLQNQADVSGQTITKITETLSALQDIQTALEVIQPHLFDIQYGAREDTQRMHKSIELIGNQSKEIAQTTHTTNKNLGTLLKQAEALKTFNAQKFNSLKEKIEQEVRLLANKSEENKNLTIHEVTTAQSDINALANKVAELGTAINHDGSNPETVDLSPLFDTIQNFVAETQLAVTNSGFENRNILLHEFSSHQTDIKEMKEFLSPLTLAIDNLSQRIEQEALNTQNRSDENRNLTLHEVTTNQSELNAISNKVSELSQNFNQTLSPTAKPTDLSPVIAAVQNLASETKLSITNSGFESRNIMLHEITTQQSDIKELKNAVFELGNALHSLDLKVSLESVRQSAEIVSAFSGLNQKTTLENFSNAPKPRDLAFTQALDKARKDHPKIFPLWFERLEELKTAFAEEGKHGNAANAADSYSNIFKGFVEGHARGSILDIGCGVHGKPHYLHAFPNNQIAGLDPLEAVEPVNFIRHTGIGEYLPWDDNSFDTIISATAIDHVLSLDQSFEEMIRLLKPEGQVLMWVGSVDGSKKYTPQAKDYKPADRFHLFHIDKAWFEPELEKYFRIGAQINMWLPQHEHVFYQLTAK